MSDELKPLPDAPTITVKLGGEPPAPLPVAEAAKGVVDKCAVEDQKHAFLNQLLAEQDELNQRVVQLKAQIVEASNSYAGASDDVLRSLAALDGARKAAGRPVPIAEDPRPDSDAPAADLAGDDGMPHAPAEAATDVDEG